MNVSYIMDFTENMLYTTFPNICSLISADPADLTKIPQKIIFPKKSWFFDRKSTLEDRNLVQLG